MIARIYFVLSVPASRFEAWRRDFLTNRGRMGWEPGRITGYAGTFARGSMSGLSSDPSREHSDPFERAFTGGASAVGAPLDFSGVFVAVTGNAAGSAIQTDHPASPPAFATEAAALSDALRAKLLPVSFGDRALLLPSEAEAWRVAVETIRRYHRIVGRPKRRRLIICMGACDESGGAPPGLEGDDDIALLRTDNLGALQAEVNAKTAGFLIAPVRTNAGLEVVPGALLAGLREIADEYGLVLAFDETFCGLGRSGMLWAYAWTGVTPDLMITTQGFAGSLPLAALIVTQKIARGAPESPPVADPAALFAAHATMDALLTPGFEDRVQNRSWYLEDRLASLLYKRRAHFTGMRGIGLMQGLVCAGEAEPMRAKFAKRGLLTRARGSVLGLFPPLTVEESEIDAAVSVLDMICAAEE
jgi:acetylornithine/N-succinyldiaminopimelate aminotransferase